MNFDINNAHKAINVYKTISVYAIILYFLWGSFLCTRCKILLEYSPQIQAIPNSTWETPEP